MLYSSLLSSVASGRGQSSLICCSPLCKVSFFSLWMLFLQFSLYLLIQQFDTMCVGVLLSVVILRQVYRHFWICRFMFSPNLGIGDSKIAFQYWFCLPCRLPVLWVSHYSFVRPPDIILQVTETSFTKSAIFLLSPLAANSNTRAISASVYGQFFLLDYESQILLFRPSEKFLLLF